MNGVGKENRDPARWANPPGSTSYEVLSTDCDRESVTVCDAASGRGRWCHISPLLGGRKGDVGERVGFDASGDF